MTTAHTAQAERGSCLAQLLDIRGFIMAARRMMHETADLAVVIVLMIIFAVIGLSLSPTYATHDLASTWSWASPMADASSSKIDDMAYALDPSGARTPILDMTLGDILKAVTLVGITMLPSLFELGFPSLRHPLLMILLWASILFDYITDFEASWNATAGWSGAENWFVHFFWANIFNLWVSIGVQAVIVLCITVVIFGFWRIFTGGAQRVEAVLIQR